MPPQSFIVPKRGGHSIANACFIFIVHGRVHRGMCGKISPAGFYRYMFARKWLLKLSILGYYVYFNKVDDRCIDYKENTRSSKLFVQRYFTFHLPHMSKPVTYSSFVALH